jgi:hypothetical protein
LIGSILQKREVIPANRIPLLFSDKTRCTLRICYFYLP